MPRIAVLLSLALTTLTAQPVRPELFLLGGAGRVTGDDAFRINALSISASATLPFSPRWALDIDASHLPAAHRITHISPGLQYRRGNPALYGFAAFGPGFTISSEPIETRPYSSRELRSSLHAHARAGVVKQLPNSFLFRAQFQTHIRPPGAAVGFSLGVGRRF